MTAGFGEGDGKSGYRNLDKNQIDLIKGQFLFYYYSISKRIRNYFFYLFFSSLLYQKTAQREQVC